MKKIYKWMIAIGIVLIVIIFTLPFAITTYINYKFSKEINVGYVSFVNFSCVKLNKVEINKPNIFGNIVQATVCYDNSISINGGKLNISIVKAQSKSKWNITAKNIEAHLTKDDVSAYLFGTSIDSQSICSTKAIISHPQADAVLFNACFNKSDRYIKASNVTITPKFDVRGNKIEEISFTGIVKATKKELIVDSIRYQNNTASNVKASVKDEFVDIDIGNLSLYHARVYKDNINVKQIHLSGIDKNDPFSSYINIKIGNVYITADIKNKRIYGKDTCKNWFDVVPQELKIWPISEMKVKGNFSFDVQLNPVSLKLNSTCSIDGKSPPFISDLSKPFKYTAYRPDGTPFERTAGPGTNDWIPLDFVDNMATALTITEDPGFWHHRGIIPKALENSLKDDMRLGRFFRGGSTITMQLAKNLWLNRSKTLGRKLQEGILTIALESCLSKEKILELYLNVVEFGPNIYGIGPGCAKFLKKYPGEITISEALYMATRLPSPNKVRSYEANKGFIQKLIAIGVASGKISEAELANELQAQQAKEIAEDEENDDEI